MWKEVCGFEGYYKISDFGEIWSEDRVCIDAVGRKRFRKGQKLNPDIAPNGYYRVTLAKNGKKTQRYLHRLLAQHFIPNPDNLPQVNHKDGNKLNCNIDNLEWVTIKDNVIHAYKHGLIDHIRGEKHPNYGKCGSKSKRAKRVMAINPNTNETKIYNAIIETKKDGFLPCEVSRSCKYGTKHHGFVFKEI